MTYFSELQRSAKAEDANVKNCQEKEKWLIVALQVMIFLVAD
jgi:hypothetical protein